MRASAAVLQLLRILLLLPAARAAPSDCKAAGGEDSLNLAGGDLPGSPHPLETADPRLCAAMCNARSEAHPPNGVHAGVLDNHSASGANRRM